MGNRLSSITKIVSNSAWKYELLERKIITLFFTNSLFHYLIWKINITLLTAEDILFKCNLHLQLMLECIYNPITTIEFLVMFTFQLDNTKR